MRATLSLVLALATLAGAASAQPIAERVAAAADGEVRFHFASRPGVCGDGVRMIRLGSSTYFGSVEFRGGAIVERDPCLPGPVRVALTVRRGEVESLRTTVGVERGRAPAGRLTDLGAVPVSEATAYLLDLAERGEGRAASRAVLPAALADSVEIWPRLLRVARAERRPKGVRDEAMLWLSRAAANAVGVPDSVLDEPGDESEDVREHAVFALSQLDDDAGVPELITIARTHESPRIRAKALFWLGQSGDRRALDLFEELLGR
jgi:hypothetical protein